MTSKLVPYHAKVTEAERITNKNLKDMSNQPQFDLDKAHRWFGIQFNNGIFPLLEKADRTEEETEKMIAMAYASTLHWSSYSGHTIANRARGEYMISTALAYAGRREQALHHAKRNYEIVFKNKNDVADFDISYALMALARAHAISGYKEKADEYLSECKKSIDDIKDEEDKKIVVADLSSGPWGALELKIEN